MSVGATESPTQRDVSLSKDIGNGHASSATPAAYQFAMPSMTGTTDLPGSTTRLGPPHAERLDTLVRTWQVTNDDAVLKTAQEFGQELLTANVGLLDLLELHEQVF